MIRCRLLLASVCVLPFLIAGESRAYDPHGQPDRPSVEINLEVLQTLRNDRLSSHYQPEPDYGRMVPRPKPWQALPPTPLPAEMPFEVKPMSAAPAPVAAAAPSWPKPPKPSKPPKPPKAPPPARVEPPPAPPEIPAPEAMTPPPPPASAPVLPPEMLPQPLEPVAETPPAPPPPVEIKVAPKPEAALPPAPAEPPPPSAQPPSPPPPASEIEAWDPFKEFGHTPPGQGAPEIAPPPLKPAAEPKPELPPVTPAAPPPVAPGAAIPPQTPPVEQYGMEPEEKKELPLDIPAIPDLGQPPSPPPVTPAAAAPSAPPPPEAKEPVRQKQEEEEGGSAFSGLSGMFREFLSSDGEAPEKEEKAKEESGEKKEEGKAPPPVRKIEPEKAPLPPPVLPELPDLEPLPPPPPPKPEASALPAPAAREKAASAMIVFRATPTPKPEIAAAPGQAKDEPVKAEPVETKLAEAPPPPAVAAAAPEPVKTEPVKTEQAKTELAEVQPEKPAVPSAPAAEDPLLELAGFLNKTEGTGAEPEALDARLEPSAGGGGLPDRLPSLSALTGEEETASGKSPLPSTFVQDVASKALPPPAPLPPAAPETAKLSAPVLPEIVQDTPADGGYETVERHNRPVAKAPPARTDSARKTPAAVKAAPVPVVKAAARQVTPALAETGEKPPAIQEVAALMAAPPPREAPAEQAKAAAEDAPDLRIAFAADETDVPAALHARLDALAVSLKKGGGRRVNIVAYANGTEEQSAAARRISLSRALAVRAYLIDKGVDSLTINVQALGNKQAGANAPDRADLFVTGG